jgi:DNA polymerase elongation subunit (family B)
MAFYTNFFEWKGKIYYRGVRKNNSRVSKVLNYCPTIYYPFASGEYSTIDGIPLKPLKFKNIYQAKTILGQSGVKVYGFNDFAYAFINEVFSQDMEYNPDLIRIGIIDIEISARGGLPSIEKADREITAISLKFDKTVYVFGCKDYIPNESSIKYIKSINEKELLENFIDYWRGLAFDIITGYNIQLFDIPYLINRMKNILKDKHRELSPWKIIKDRIVERNNREYQVYEICGLTIMDYYLLYKKFERKKKESYKLDFIAQEELGIGKIAYKGSLDDLYDNDYTKYIDYNIQDVVLIEKLEDKLGYLDMAIAMAYAAKCNYGDIYVTIKPWDIIIHNFLLARKIVVPQIEKKEKERIMGAFVKEPAIGMHRWVVSFDITSLYPNLIRVLNISPETYVGKYKQGNYTKAANGCCYRKDICGFMYEVVSEKFNKREEYKKAMFSARKAGNEPEALRFENKQYAQKIFLNSFYGAFLNNHFRWFSRENGEAITSTGQQLIKFIFEKINLFLNKRFCTANVCTDWVIGGDTDSCFISVEPFVIQLQESNEQIITEKVVEFCEKELQPYLMKCFEEFSSSINAYNQHLTIKLEKVCQKILFTSKKKYLCNLLYDEGTFYDKPILTITGQEAIRSSTSQVCRNNIKKAIEIIMNGTEIEFRDFVKDFKEDFLKMSFEEVATPRSVNKLTDYESKDGGYIKATPQHVKASILYNALLKKYAISDISPIYNGDKIKYSYLKIPNPLKNNIIASLGSLPPQFGLDEYVDKEKQFEKTFLNPIIKMTDIIGWKVKKEPSLEKFYVD